MGRCLLHPKGDIAIVESSFASTIESYLIDYGWNFRRLTPEHWQTGFQGKERQFLLHIFLSETWVSLNIPIYLDLAIDWESWPEIAKYLLELNHGSSMLRLSLCDSGRISLSLEVFTAQLSYEIFCTSMGLMGFYADWFYDEILNRLDSLGYRYTDKLKLLT